MTDVHLTDDTALAAENEQRARAALALAPMIGRTRTDQAIALITAATVLIEQDVGVALAPAALMALVEPTIADWQSSSCSNAGLN